jgi:hypothetical protein
VYCGRYHLRQALDIEILVPLLRREGHSVQFIYDSNVFGVTDNVFQQSWLARLLCSLKQIKSKIVATKPDVVIMSVLPSTFKWACSLTRSLKETQDVSIVFSGLFPSLAPKAVIEERSVDYVIQGETENSIPHLLDAICRGNGLSKVGNLWYRKEKEVFYTGPAPLVDLDALPLPDKELFRPDLSHAYSYTTFVSRGCTFGCSYCEETCMKTLFSPRYFRRKSVDAVMRELVVAKTRYNYREVIFKDSYLSGSKEWLRQLIHQYRIKIAVPFKCFCTIRGFDEEVAQLLKKGGCYCIEFGLQTWNENLRKKILNRKETNQEACSAFEICDKFGIRYDIDHMFNLPYESHQDHKDGALIYSRLSLLNRIKVHHLVYYPGAEIIKHGIESGTLPADIHRQILTGRESDFYDQRDEDRKKGVLVTSYSMLYKILPVIPKACLHWLLIKNRVRVIRWIPKPILFFLQAYIAVRNKDLRFRTYLTLYPRKVLLAVRRRLFYALTSILPNRQVSS